MGTVDGTIKSIKQKYTVARNNFNNMQKETSGSMLSQNLKLILVEPVVSKDDFVYTHHLETVIAYVPKNLE